MINLANRLKELRTSKNLTQKVLAEKMNVSKGMISAYENSHRNPNHENLVKLADIFNVTIDYLLGIDNRESLDVTGVSEKMRTVISDLISIDKHSKNQK